MNCIKKKLGRCIKLNKIYILDLDIDPKYLLSARYQQIYDIDEFEPVICKTCYVKIEIMVFITS